MDLKFSLIIGTLNREKVLKICLQNLCEQSYKNFEVIIVDQSSGDRTKNIVSEFDNKLDIIYIHSERKGLSLARNIGLKKLSGDYYCLLDDDGEYSNDYLDNAREIIESKKRKTIISGIIYDNITDGYLAPYGRIKNDNQLTSREITRFCPSAALVIPSDTIKDNIYFDESFGVGALYGAGEESDFLLRCRYYGYIISHSNTLLVKHPIVLENEQTSMPIEKLVSYSYGIGALYKKHICYCNNYQMIGSFVEELVKRILMLILKKDRANQIELIKGFINGYKNYKKVEKNDIKKKD